MLEFRGSQAMRRVLDGVQVPFPAREIVVLARLRIVPDAVSSGRMVGIIVILMDGANGRSRVDHRSSQRTRAPNEPVVPPDAADDERRHIAVETVGKYKIVDAGGVEQGAPVGDISIEP